MHLVNVWAKHPFRLAASAYEERLENEHVHKDQLAYPGQLRLLSRGFSSKTFIFLCYDLKEIYARRLWKQSIHTHLLDLA